MNTQKHLTSNSHRCASANLHSFITYCQDELTLFNDIAGFSWDSHNWPKFRLVKLNASRQIITKDILLDVEFIDFAKAYYRYQQSHAFAQSPKERYALRALEAALLQVTGCAQVPLINREILDLAAQLIRSKFSLSTAYCVGRSLESLAIFLSQQQLTDALVPDWKNPIKPTTGGKRTNHKGKQAIDAKLPSKAAMLALAELFASDPDDPLTIFTTSVWALLLGGGFRVGEVFDLKINAEIEEYRDDGELRYGLRYEGRKGWGSDIKWIEKNYTPVVKEAFQRLLKLSAPGRALANHLKKKPEEAYRPARCIELSCSYPMTKQDLTKYISSAFYKWELKIGSTLQDVHAYALRHLPDEFPHMKKLSLASPNLKWSESLFCYRLNELNYKNEPNDWRLWRPRHSTISDALKFRQDRESHQSIFEKYGYSEEDGSPIKITSHQARHFLNTVAERGGMAQEDIARFFGRADMKSNRVYNHMTDEEMVAKAKRLDLNKQLFGIDEQLEMNVPVNNEDVELIIKTRPAHATEYGICSHDFVQSPCDKFRQCLSCTEHVFKKGQQDQLVQIRNQLKLTEEQHRLCVQAMANGKFGANRWFEYNQDLLQRLQKLVELMESDEIEEGALIQLDNDNEFSFLNRAFAQHKNQDDLIEQRKILEDQGEQLVNQYRITFGDDL